MLIMKVVLNRLVQYIGVGIHFGKYDSPACLFLCPQNQYEISVNVQLRFESHLIYNHHIRHVRRGKFRCSSELIHHDSQT